MRSRQVTLLRSSTTLLALTCGLATSMVGCGDERDPVGSAGNPGGVGANAATGGGASGGGGAGGSGGSAQGGGGGEAPELGDLTIEDIADTACSAPGGSPVELFAGEKAPPVFSQLVTVGSRRAVGGGFGIEGFVSFASNGSGGSLPPIATAGGDNRMASEGTTLGAAGRNGAAVVYQRYDSDGLKSGAEQALGSGAVTQPWIASGAAESLIVWGNGDGMVLARGIDSAGSAVGAQPFEVQKDAFANTLTAAVARAGSAFALVWSGPTSSGDWVTSFATATTSGLSAGPTELIRSKSEHKVSRLLATSSGFALLLTARLPDLAPHVVLLDGQGKIVGTSRRLAGAHFGWDLAVAAGELGVLASRASGEPQFRPFDAAMKPLGPWVCLGSRGDIDLPMALDVDGSGYAAVYYLPDASVAADGQEFFVRFGHLGSDAP